ncbi:phage tail protein [Marinomonas primoryensis]|uniref:Phage tail protein n=1 Tax=Marinomonas primoryensis TaxID=178399 RepID=A0A2Z4PPQ2_9GAMM|nr:phage tail protein [Marinomonas primoryensis]AWX99505.1 phage tail protein [Marinomonas primoryensis]
MIDIKLVFWFTADESSKLIKAAKTWWERAESWIRWPLTQMDALTASIGIVNLLAYQRDIQRFPSEPENLYRKRVKYALINAKDAGSKTGFVSIFERLGIGYVELEERDDEVDWDVITLRLSDSQLSENTSLLDLIIQKYGRTCRRYRLEVISPISISVGLIELGHSWSLDVAEQKIEPMVAESGVVGSDIGHSWSLDIASN